MNPHRGPHGAVFDHALQPERTLLAWRRTCLAFAVTSLLGMRFTLSSFGPLAVLTGTLGAGLAILAYVLAVVGYRTSHRSLHATGALTRSGLPMLAATSAVLVVGGSCAMLLVATLISS